MVWQRTCYKLTLGDGLKIYEYQAKEILRENGISVPKGFLYSGDLSSINEQDKYVLKAQVYAGGRGKAGGVKIVRGKKEVSSALYGMLGMKLVTPQTGSEGVVVEKVLIEEHLLLSKEFYVAITLDRSRGVPVLLASAGGGVDIEESAGDGGACVFREDILSPDDIIGFKLRRLARKAGLEGQERLFGKLVDIFFKYDASLIEINPLVLTEDNQVIAADAKMIFDDNAIPRHKNLAELRDPRGEDEREFAAQESGISYVSLDGSVGCMVNGAGLAMATMDIIKFYGANPANFLDVGGGASKEKVKLAFRILLSDNKVKVVLINIFGGIMRCDILAEAIVEVVREDVVTLPVVVRMKGTNYKEGRSILGESGFSFSVAENMDEAAKLSVSLL